MKYLIVVAALIIGIVIGGVAVPPKVRYKTDSRFSDLKQVDEDIFEQYSNGLTEASGMLTCIQLDDYDCLDERTDEVERITKQVEVLFNQRDELTQ